MRVMGLSLVILKFQKSFGRRIAIRIPTQYGAYRMYVNGQFIVRLGEISTTPENR